MTDNLTKSQLETKIRLANQAYAKAQPFLTDFEYDQLWQKLHQIDPTSEVLYHTAKDPSHHNQVLHQVPVLSLQKAFDMEDLKVFLQRYRNEPLLVQPKYDGMAVMLYSQPDFVMMVKAGDGQKGDDVSHHLKHFDQSLVAPYLVSRLSCEAIILLEDFSPELGANPRNVIAGLVNRRTLDPTPPVKLTLVPHDYLSQEITPSEMTLTQLETYLLETFTTWSKTYPMDGLVLKVKNQNLRLKASHNGVFPNWAIAWKPPIQTAETTITSVEWNVSRQGKIIPTLTYEPVTLCGTTNSRVTGNNAEWIKSRELGPGAKVRLGKAGEIIPQVVEILQGSPLDLPLTCPVCGSFLELESPHLVCSSENCLPQLVKRLSYFYSHKGIEVKNLGERMIERLLNHEKPYHLLKNSPWALLAPERFGLSEVANFVWGEKTYNNYLASIPSDPLPLDSFMSGLGYSRLSKKGSLTLLQTAAGYSPRKANVSSEARANFIPALQELARAKDELADTHLFAPVPEPASTIFCITGTLSISRSEMINYLSQKGWTFQNSISRNVDYLILGDLPSETRKLKDARRLGTTILREEDIP